MERIDDVTEAIEQRAFLYDDPESFKAGVREAVRALAAVMEGAREQYERPVGAGV